MTSEQKINAHTSQGYRDTIKRQFLAGLEGKLHTEYVRIGPPPPPRWPYDELAIELESLHRVYDFLTGTIEEGGFGLTVDDLDEMTPLNLARLLLELCPRIMKEWKENVLALVQLYEMESERP